MDVLSAFLLATVLGVAAYGGFFLLLSLVTRRPLAVGLLFGFVWESIVGSVPGDVPKLSIIYYLRSILNGLIKFPAGSYVSALDASFVLIGVSAGTLVLAMLVFQKMEFTHKA